MYQITEEIMVHIIDCAIRALLLH